MGKIVIVDYGMGNVTSVQNALTILNIDSKISKCPIEISHAKAAILPGVGAFHAAMENIVKLGILDALNELVINKKRPFLGICLGLQLIAEDSVESIYTKGFGWIKGNVYKIPAETNLPVPHVGWNNVLESRENIILSGINDASHFYFDHSYYLDCPEQYIVANSNYGNKFVAAVQKDNIFAVQFHPEKSQRSGLRLLRNFSNFVENY